MKYKNIKNKVILGDCLNVMKEMPDNCIDTIITDPPYDIKHIFSNVPKNIKWNPNSPTIEMFKEMLRISKPGAAILCFGGTRTFHRVAVNMEDAGWNINDTMGWVYGQGFPKSVDISYMIDKNAGTFGKLKQQKIVSPLLEKGKRKNIELYEPSTNEAKKWYGWGTKLKEAWEPIIVGSKSIEGNYDDNAIQYGVCGLWIDGGRIKTEDTNFGINRTSNGRWPTNLLFDEETIKELDKNTPRDQNNKVSRFFYCVKNRRKSKKVDIHPTMKPIELMEYLCKITKTPTGGIVFDPFGGSGTTAIACMNTNRYYCVIEKEKEYYEQCLQRIKKNKKRIKPFFN